MSGRQDMICIGTPAWEGNYTKSTVMLMKELSQKFRILYVDYQYTWKDAAMRLLGSGEAPLLRMTGLAPRLRTVESGTGAAIHVLTPPPIIPVQWIDSPALYHRVHSWNARLLRSSIRRAMRQLQFKDPVVVNAFNPSFGVPLAGGLDESLLVYYCYDNISAAGWLSKHGEAAERTFAQLADRIITSSDHLATRFPEHTSKVSVVKNGVDIGSMGSAFTEYSERNPPVVGYIGSIDERLDLDLLEQVMTSLPDHRFRFVGRVTEEQFRERLQRHPNAELLGPHPASALPAFLREMDVCIIPFAATEFNRSVYPMKVNEYLAAGKPVVMTPFADLPEFSGVVTVAGRESFACAIQNAHRSDSTELRHLRQEFARFQSWSSRAASFAEIIRRDLHNRTAGVQ